MPLITTQLFKTLMLKFRNIKLVETSLQSLKLLRAQLDKGTQLHLILNFPLIRKKIRTIFAQCMKLKVQNLEQIKYEVKKIIEIILGKFRPLQHFGEMLQKTIAKEIKFFYGTKSAYGQVNKTDHEVDKQVKKIIHFYSSPPSQKPQKFEIQKKYENNLELSQLQQQVRNFYDINKLKNPKQKQKIKQELKQCFQKIFQSDKTEYLIQTKCLRCTTHFITQKQSQETFNNATVISINQCFYPIDVYSIQNYQEFGKIQSQVRASLCTMLNEPTGGIVLIGRCEKIGTKIIPNGFFITEKGKDSLQQKIQGYFTKIVPKIKRNEQIFIDFVPIYEDSKKGPIPLQGKFVCRIFAKTKDIYKTYFVALQKSMYLQKRVNGEQQRVSGTYHYSNIIEKFNSYFELPTNTTSMNLRSDQQNLCHYKINCFQPSRGKMSFDKKQQPLQDPKTNKTQKNKNNMKDIKTKNINQYKLWTLAVGDQNTANQIRTAALKENKSLFIQKIFPNQNFKLVKTTWVIYHDDKFEVIQKMINKAKIFYKNKQIHLISVSLYLRILDGRIGKEHYNQLIQKVKSQGGIKGQVSIPQQKNKSKFNTVLQFYTLKGAVLAYFKLSQIGYRVKLVRGAKIFTNQQKNTHAESGPENIKQLDQTTTSTNDSFNQPMNNQNQQNAQTNNQIYYQFLIQSFNLDPNDPQISQKLQWAHTIYQQNYQYYQQQQQQMSSQNQYYGYHNNNYP